MSENLSHRLWDIECALGQVDVWTNDWEPTNPLSSHMISLQNYHCEPHQTALSAVEKKWK